ncbi:unnamed protein product [Soboliphyme baturini]|uniref:CSN8_PSD8_EIF3K domain-containing protein n=1 Tax=Soboliphyme baturini TaxID=241478 RepID=A0A183IX91_9BILA|nr:unnamed protein product [Soboliphyme baturini]
MLQPADSDIEALENRELESGLDPSSYAFLLARYLELNELSYALLLWKRIPKETKAENGDVGAVWDIGKKLWVLDFVGAYAAMKKEWNEPLR